MGNAWALMGDNIRLARESAGLSQADLAEKSGLTVQSISRIETGKSNPRRANLDAIAKALNVPRDRFLGVFPDDMIKALSSAAEFLSKLQGKPHSCQRIVFALVFDDESFLDGLSPASVRTVQSLLSMREKPS